MYHSITREGTVACLDTNKYFIAAAWNTVEYNLLCSVRFAEGCGYR